MKITRTIKRAWPAADIHQLLVAAISPDHETALAGAQAWLSQNDLDNASFNEHRLLSAIVERFGSDLSDLKEYPRLIGLQRLNWTKSRMNVGDVMPTLSMMAEAGISIVLLKGAGRVAKDVAEQKSRTSYDVDILVPGGDFAKAFDILMQMGWRSNRGESERNLRARLGSVRARNFVRGKFGDIDLHRFAFPVEHSNPEADAALLKDLEPVHYYGVKAFVPGPEERILIAVAHAGREDDSHSDWLIDCTRILTRETLDWTKLQTLATQRRLRAETFVALSYLSEAIGLTIPPTALEALAGSGLRAKGRLAVGALLRRRRQELTAPARALRFVMTAGRKLRYPRQRGKDGRPRFGSLLRRTNGGFDTQHARLIWPLDIPDTPAGTRLKFRVTLRVPLPPAQRRIEFEMNTKSQCVCSLFTLVLQARGGTGHVTFRGTITAPDDLKTLTLEARPGKIVYGTEPQSFLDKYERLAFQIVAFSAKPV